MRRYHWHNYSFDHKGSSGYLHHRRRYWTLYKTYFNIVDEKTGEPMQRQIFEGHIETIVKGRPFNGDYLSTRFHIGNLGSETPWDGHFMLFGVGFFWGHSAFARLAGWLTRCWGYKWDSRDWVFRISDGNVWWSFAEHNDMCDKFSGWEHMTKQELKKGKRQGKRKRKSRFRRGSFAYNPMEWIFGPKRYTYEDFDGFATVLRFPEGEYPLLVNLQKVFYGRVKTDKKKHEQSWTLEVEAPSGVPVYPDKGGWKGDSVYQWGVKFHDPEEDEFWKYSAERAIHSWVLNERAKSGWRPETKEKN